MLGLYTGITILETPIFISATKDGREHWVHILRSDFSSGIVSMGRSLLGSCRKYSQAQSKETVLGPHITYAQKVRALSYFQSNVERMFASRQNGVPIIFVVPVRDIQRAPLGGCHDSPCATELYDKGITLRGSDPKQASVLLKKAVDADEVPLRVLTKAQDFLRSLSGDGVYVVDAPAQLAQSGIVPSELFQDHVHLTTKGHQEVAKQLHCSCNKKRLGYKDEMVGGRRISCTEDDHFGRSLSH